MNENDLRQLTITNLTQCNQMSADANTGNVDLRDYVGTVALHIDATESNGAGTLAIHVQTGDQANHGDMSNASVAFTTLSANTTGETIYVDTRAVNRYLRVVEDITGAGAIFTRSISLIGRKQVA